MIDQTILVLISGFKMAPRGGLSCGRFPKDEGLKFSKTTKGAKVEVVKDIFNISSNLKKAAIFTGDNLQDSFGKEGWSIFKAAEQTSGFERFLLCQLSVSGIYGTTLLSEHLTEAYRSADSVTVREELFNAIIGVRTAPIRRTSFLKFANDYLSTTRSLSF